MSPSNALPVTQSALDFEGLGKLRAQARQDESQAVKETAQQFEAMFIQMMVKSMRETVDKGELSDSNGQETFENMFDREVAHQMAKRGSFGLADMLVKDHERRSQMLSTADALQAREAAAPALKALHAPAQGLPLQDTSARPLPLPAARALKALAPESIHTGGKP